MRWAVEDRDTPWYLRAMPTWSPEPVGHHSWARCSVCRGVFPGRYRELLRIRVAKDGQPAEVCPECDERPGDHS